MQTNLHLHLIGTDFFFSTPNELQWLAILQRVHIVPVKMVPKRLQTQTIALHNNECTILPDNVVKSTSLNHFKSNLATF